MTEIARPGPVAGIALAASGIALVLASLVEFSSGARGDADNPAESLRYLAEHGNDYSYSGLALVIGGVLIVSSVVGLLRLTAPSSYAFTVSSVFGLLAGGCLAVAGIMRLQAVGTVPYIQSLNQSWGEAAYLVVQMAGGQGLLSTGIVALAAWLVSLAVVCARRRLWWPVAFAVFPSVVLAVLTLDLLAPSMASSDASEFLFLAYVGAITVGMPLCCMAFGIAIALAGGRRRLEVAG